MPDILRDIHPIESILRTELYTLYHCTIIIVGIHSNSTTKQYKRLTFCRMVMYLNLSSWLRSINLIHLSSNDI